MDLLNTKTQKECVVVLEREPLESDSDSSVKMRPSSRSSVTEGRLWMGAKRQRRDDSVSSNDADSVASEVFRPPTPVGALDLDKWRKREVLAQRRAKADLEAVKAIEVRNREASEMHSALGLVLAESGDDRTVAALNQQVLFDVQTIENVAKTSKHLQGPFVRALKNSATSLKAVVEVLSKRTTTEETAKLQAANARLESEIAELRKEMADLRKEMAQTRGGTAPPSPRRISPERMEVPESFPPPSQLEELTRSIMLQVGSMLSARLETLEERLLPEKRLRPDLAADRKAAATAAAKAGEPAKRKGKATPGIPVKSTSKKAADSCLPAKGTSKRQVPQPAAKGAPTRVDTCPLPLAPESIDKGWSTVVKRGGKKGVVPQSSSTAQVSAKGAKPGAKNQPTLTKLRPPRSAAVVITLQPGAAEKGLTYAKVLAVAREKVDLSSCGVTGLRYRQAATGARMLEVPGATSGEKADSLAQKLRENLDPELVKISRPTKCAELRVSGLDDSVSADEVAAAVARSGLCSVESVKVGEIRRDSRSNGTVWVKCPVTAAKKLGEGGRLLIGWVAAQVKLLQPKPMQCYRCLQKGHVRAQCTAEVDHSDECFRCGRPGHKAAQCSSKPRCSLCAAANKPAEHRMGSKQCSPPKPKKGTKTPAASSTPPTPMGDEEEMINN